MNIPQELRQRINFQGEFDEMLQDVCKAYHLGEFVSFEPILLGLEDFNLKLVTSTGNYFVKIFADSRDEKECLRLVNIVKNATDNDVSHPQFLKHDEGYIFRERYEDFNIRLAVFEFIEGKTFYELNRSPKSVELKEIIRMAASINEIGYKPAPVYDSWAIVNYPKELEKSREYLDKKMLVSLDKLLSEFEKVNIVDLPHSLVHGDLIRTNIIKAKDNIYFVDFSAANYYPRIIELAVLMADIMFDETGAISVEKYYKTLITEYQEHIKLTKEELDVLPLFIQLGHAMRYVRGTRAKAKGSKSDVIKAFISRGKLGLEESLKTFK